MESANDHKSYKVKTRDKRHTGLPPVNDVILYTAIKSGRGERESAVANVVISEYKQTQLIKSNMSTEHYKVH